MQSQQEKIREAQRAAWNKSSTGWKKWDDIVMAFLKPISDEMIAMIKPGDNFQVLDVATGTGEPGLSIAHQIKDGHVTATDLSEEMVAIARENATRKGIQNFSVVCCDASSLPFQDKTFDAITCRLGFMFFYDMQQTLQEMMRVLKPGGCIIASTWNDPEKNFWINASQSTMISALDLPRPAPGAPGLFRCAPEGLMASEFQAAGLKNIKEKEVTGQISCGSLESHWLFVTEVASPLAFHLAEPDIKERIKEAFIRKADERYPHGYTSFPSSANVIYGEK